jgi:hypothetical protein
MDGKQSNDQKTSFGSPLILKEEIETLKNVK